MIIRNATDNKLININGEKSLAPDEWMEIEAEDLTPGIRALVLRGQLSLAQKPVVTEESLELLKTLEKEKEEADKAVEEAVEAAEEPEAEPVEEVPVKKTTTRKKKAE